MKLRRATVDDAQTLSRLARETFYDTFVGTCTDEDMRGYLAETYSVEKLRQELSDPEDLVFLAETANELDPEPSGPVGYLRMKEGSEGLPSSKQWKALECKRLYVRKEFHRKGVAQLLMDHFMNYALQNHYEVVWLGVWEFNYRAQRFYSKYGFVPNGHSHPFPIQNTPQTDIWLWRFLTDPSFERTEGAGE